ncbi:acyl-CoA dehydrogenase family protein [Nocardioides ungokensis]|uniref:acyl-CoA dehydrogenase family protein n=1 Tax=Nocardioides ungokensis TaxID=1643322 RepID=UPI003CCE0200
MAPHAAQWTATTTSGRRGAEDGQARAVRPHRAGGVRGMGEDGDFTSLCVAIEEIGRVDQSMGITLEAAVGLGINPILTYAPRSRRPPGCPTWSLETGWPASA